VHACIHESLAELAYVQAGRRQNRQIAGRREGHTFIQKQIGTQTDRQIDR